MDKEPSQEMVENWHRWFAIECNNGAWDLFSRPARSVVDQREMLWRAYAAAYHWSMIGTPIHIARAEITLAHALSLANRGAEALLCAQSALDSFERNPGEDWDRAFAHAEISFAAAVMGNLELHALHYDLAQRLGTAIIEPGDRQVFMEEFSRLPRLQTG